MKKQIIYLVKFVVIVVLFHTNAYAQFTPSNMNNVWYFGDHAGLSWNTLNGTGNPIPLMDGQLVTNEGCASICDPSGNLLFYTDGITVWSANHMPMTNSMSASPGGTLYGSPSSTQSGVIVPDLLDSNTYYLFVVDNNIGADGLSYSRIDMSANSGMGDVDLTEKNILLYTPSTEKIATCLHANGMSFWVVTHEWNNNSFVSYLVDSSGVHSANPVVSSVGTVHSGSSGVSRGYMKISHQQNKLVVAIEGLDYYELFDFDASTGIISNHLFLGNSLFDDCYGVEFSPSGQYLYGSERWGYDVWQWDLFANDIQASVVSVGTLGSANGGALQLASDSKIYLARNNTEYLGRINNPDQPGLLSNYVDQGVLLGTTIQNAHTSKEGLPGSIYPNIPQSSLNANFVASDTLIIYGNTVSFTDMSLGNITGWLWDFGDGTNSTIQNPSHIYQNVGVFSVSLTVSFGAYSDILSINNYIVVNQPDPLTVISLVDNISCYGETDGSIDLDIVGGYPPYSVLWSNGATTEDLSNLSAGIYDVTVTESIIMPWLYQVTGSNHIMLVQTGTVTINGSPIEVGDYIGAFFLDGGDYVCGGYTVWNGSTTSVTAWGVDNGSDGFVSGETFNWKVWKASDSTIVDMVATYQIAGFPNQGTFAANGISGIETMTGNYSSGSGDSITFSFTITEPVELIVTGSLSDYYGFGVSGYGVSDGYIDITVAGGVSPYSFLWLNVDTMEDLTNIEAGVYEVIITDANGCTINETFNITQPDVQIIILPEFWSLFSTYLIPVQPNIFDVTLPVLQNISIVKDWQGQAYWPQYYVNLIGDMTPGDSYSIKMLVEDTLVIEGSVIQPDTLNIILPQFWSLLGYTRTAPAPILEMLFPVVNNTSIVKDWNGQAYWPQYGVDLIGDMQPGQGYAIKMFQQDILVYPANVVLPVLTTDSILNIAVTTATGGGEVTDEGGSVVTARGVCWNTTGSPTTADAFTNDGIGTGVFISNLTNLTANTIFYVRAYATNSEGTTYGNEMQFTMEVARFMIR